ncbi:MAG: phosphomannomutase/phosphoglucomutase, partial [Bacteroidales bacterium]|nr:phosphomannomutase/phosphoglucomutase [Bacteroidales bacterium]
ALPGVKNEEVNLTPDRIYKLACAFQKWLYKSRKDKTVPLLVSVGMDSRISGPELKQSFINGLVNSGCNVYDVGLASTPAMFMSTVMEHTECDGAVMLTASHLPFNRNGLKFFSKNGGLEKQDIAEILTYSENEDFLKTSHTGWKKSLDFISLYAEFIVNKIRTDVNHPEFFEKPLSGAKIIVDAGNGAGGFFATKILKPLGADISGSQFLEPDGNFPNHIPNPEDQKAMESVSKAVIRENAELGIIFDTDVDRAAIVDKDGTPINRNRLIALISSIVLEEHPGTYIVTDSITSTGLTEFIENRLQGKHHRFKRGYRNVINEAMRLNSTGKESWLAIETSGHAALKENYFLDDGAYLIAKILIKFAQLRLHNKGSLSGLISALKEPLESKEFRLHIHQKDFISYGNQIINKLGDYVQHIEGWKIVPDNYEGIRIFCDFKSGNGWLLLRMSLHDPVLPLNIESEEEDGVRKISMILYNFLKSYQDIDLSPLKSVDI